jgi:predicted nucleic acid-binding protein
MPEGDVSAGELVADTDALIALLETGGGAAATVQAAITGRRVVLPRTVVQQFLRRGSQEVLDDFLQRSGATIVPDGAGSTVAALRRCGLHEEDARIAGAAQDRGAMLITFDKRLARRVPEVTRLLLH